MARKRVDTAPQFNVGADSVLIQQVSGSTSTIFEVKNSAGASVMAIDSSGATTATFAAGVGLPVGMITPFAGATAPTGWFLCSGQEVAIASYGALYAVVGTTYGSLTNGSNGVGTTHFRLPDLRGRTVIGVGTGTGLTARALADTPGAETVTLTSAQSGVPAHTHPNTLTNNAVTTGTGSAHSHASTASFSGSFSGTAASHTHTQNAHSHLMNYADNGSIGSTRSVLNAAQTTGSDTGEMGSTAAVNQSTSITPAGSISGTVTMSNPSESSHTHSVTSNVSISNAANTAANASSPVSLMQPTIVLNYIVRY